MRRESAGVGSEGGGPGRLPFFGDCLPPRDRLAGTGLLARCFVAGVLERCSTRMLLGPKPPAALLTREALLASILGPTRPCCFRSFLWSSAAIVVPSFFQETLLYDSAYVPGKQVYISLDNPLRVRIHIHRMVSQKANQRNATLVRQFDGQTRWGRDGRNAGNARQQRFLDDFERGAPAHQQDVPGVRKSI